MEIKLKFKKLEKLSQKVFKTQFKAEVRRVKEKVNTAQKATNIFIHQEHNFTDGIGPLIIMGKLTGDWKSWALDTVKKNKNKTLIGKGYVTVDSLGNQVFTFVNVKGDGKIEKIKKAAKALLIATKFRLNLVKTMDGVVVEDMEPQEVVDNNNNTDIEEPQEVVDNENNTDIEESQEVVDNDNNTDTDESKKTDTDKVVLPQIKALMKDIATSFKGQVKSTIVPAIRKNEATADHLTVIENIEGQIDELTKIVETTSAAFQAKLKRKLTQILNLTPTVEKLKTKLTERLEAGAGSAENTATARPLSQEQRATYGQERKQMMEELRSFLAEEVAG